MNGRPYSEDELRAIERMRAGEGRTYAEIAQALGRTANAVALICNRHSIYLNAETKHANAVRRGALQSENWRNHAYPARDRGRGTHRLARVSGVKH